MKASELRLGNFVINREGIVEVDAIDFYGINGFHDTGIGGDNYEFGGRFEEISPIPLTEDWLVKFGFDEDCGCYFKTYKKSGGVAQFCVFINDKKFVQELDVTDFYFNGTLMGFLKIESIHQLQNLYAILTGGELTLI